MDTSVDIIWVMMNLKKYAENPGKMIIFIHVFIDQEKKDQGRYCICNEIKNTYIQNTPEKKPF